MAIMKIFDRLKLPDNHKTKVIARGTSSTINKITRHDVKLTFVFVDNVCQNLFLELKTSARLG